MNISKELLEKAKQAKTAEELLAFAKSENIELTPEQTAEYFTKINASGELSDEELDNVSGGGCGGSTPRFKVNDRVSHKGSGGKDVCGTVVRVERSRYYYVYYVVDDGEATENEYDATELTPVGVVGGNLEICKSIR
ncbi:MAG: hypothetical protein ACI4SF_08370 [Oscillospiraceae bacterium]